MSKLHIYNTAPLKRLFLSLLNLLFVFNAYSQKVLGIKEAEQTALDNYPAIKAKANQLKASKAYLSETKTEYLPDVNLSGQQDYGTVNTQFGPLYSYRGLSVASSGPVLAKQNWNAAFGSLYLANVSWDVFSFGKAVEKVKVQKQAVNRDESDLRQETFEDQIKVASSYLNLLAAQQLAKAQDDNLKRALALQKVVVARVINGLNPGVDSSQANAEVASAKIALINAQETEQEQSNILTQYLGIPPPSDYILDSTFVTRIPKIADPEPQVDFTNHPLLQFYNNRINVSIEQAKYLSTFSYPTFTLFGVYQARGTGFTSTPTSAVSSVTATTANTQPYVLNSSYGAGADPTRFNYLFGAGVIWNLTTPFRVHFQVRSQKYTSAQYKDEYDLISQQLRDQAVLAETRINNAYKNYRLAPEEVKAANDAFNQKFTLYNNGLANIVDFTQALYVLNRAEVDRYIAFNNVWQAILYKAAATGDFGIFINNF